MAGLVPAIHILIAKGWLWMAATRLRQSFGVASEARPARRSFLAKAARAAMTSAVVRENNTTWVARIRGP
jgi:hypothetical protein